MLAVINIIYKGRYDKDRIKRRNVETLPHILPYPPAYYMTNLTAILNTIYTINNDSNIVSNTSPIFFIFNHLFNSCFTIISFNLMFFNNKIIRFITFFKNFIVNFTST